MPPECSAYPVVQANYLWDYDSVKKTLKEMEHEMYYSCGEYPKADTLVHHKRYLTGQHEQVKQIERDGWGPGNWIRDAAGFRASGHLSAPREKHAYQRFKRLGHVKENKLVGWDLQKPRDNSMYNLGEGGTNLKKMDKHIKKKQGNILNLFSNHIINDSTLQRMKKKKVKVGMLSQTSGKGSKRADDANSQMSKTTGFETMTQGLNSTSHPYDHAFKMKRTGHQFHSGDSNAFINDTTKPTYLFHDQQSVSAQDHDDALTRYDKADLTSEIKQLRKLGIKKAASNDQNAFFGGTRGDKNLTFLSGSKSNDSMSEFQMSKLKKEQKIMINNFTVNS